MSTFLFDKIIFGPVNSRRLGQSLGINLLPTDNKICNFDCIYCECGLTEKNTGNLPSRKEVEGKLKEVLFDYSNSRKRIDAITFAGNGEPTLHPEFAGIIDDTYRLRNIYFPKAKIALLTNSTTAINQKLHKAFRKIDQNIFKIDSVLNNTICILNQPLGNYNLQKIIESIGRIENRIIQTMFLKGSFDGKTIDNTSEEEIVPWLEALASIKPMLVMIYTIERNTPFDTLNKIPLEKLTEIAERVKAIGLEVQISG
jgi:wyosine [tRNA(Phe)-imidazoG37] synthetase (radical SAM superfamily)